MRVVSKIVVPRGTRDYRLIPELQRTLEGRALLDYPDPQGHFFLRVLHLDYVGEPDPPWGDREVVQVLLTRGSRVPYRGKKGATESGTSPLNSGDLRDPWSALGPLPQMNHWTPKGAFSYGSDQTVEDNR
jgi:hypothetical protein